MKCVVSGGTGFIGRHVADRLRAFGYGVQVWGRSVAALNGIEGSDAIIHLAGEPVAQRWNADVKRRIRESRVMGTRHLVDAIANLAKKPSVLVCASAIGIYGDRGDEILTESSAPGTGFLADVCQGWEEEAARAKQFGVRVVQLRIGIVLGKGGGALAQMLPAFRLFAGGRLGSGKQWMPWIHIEDIVGLAVRAVDDESVRGVWNATAPNPVRNVDFTRELASAVHRPAILPVPLFALKLAFGEMAQHMVGSTRVIPQEALKAGYSFRYAELEAALRELV